MEKNKKFFIVSTIKLTIISIHNVFLFLKLIGYTAVLSNSAVQCITNLLYFNILMTNKAKNWLEKQLSVALLKIKKR